MTHPEPSWNPALGQRDRTLRLLTELSIFEKVTVTDAMAEDVVKLRLRLTNIHMRELVVAITRTPKPHTQNPIFTSLLRPARWKWRQGPECTCTQAV